MSKAVQPELKKFMDRKMLVKLNGGRKVSGVLRGYDPFMNIVLDDAVEEVSQTEKHSIGMIVVRGNSITMIELLEKL